MKKVLVLILLCLTACQGVKGNNGDVGPQGPTTPPVVVTVTEIDALVADENDWRESQGQTMLSPGLSCSVQQVSSGSFLSSSSPSYVAASCTANPFSSYCTIVVMGASYAYLGSNFNQVNASAGPNSVITDAYVASLFVGKNYKITCSGQIVITDEGYHSFTLASDDGSILTVNGAQVVNADGQHGITTTTGVKLLRPGVYSFSLAYAQSGLGAFALILSMDGAVLPAANLYH